MRYEIDQQPGIEQIYCLGDMVDIGLECNEVLGMLSSRPDVRMIAGNHDQYVLALATGKEPEIQGEVLEHARWIAGRRPGSSF